jgi:hypothetical protein
MSEIFEADSQDVDPWLDILFMDTAEGGIEISLAMYDRCLRSGCAPERAYEIAISRPQADSEVTSD